MENTTTKRMVHVYAGKREDLTYLFFFSEN